MFCLYLFCFFLSKNNRVALTSHPRRLEAKIPALIMPENNMPREPRIDGVAVSPEQAIKKAVIIQSNKR